MTARKIIRLIVLLIAALFVAAVLMSMTRSGPPMALYLTSVGKTNGVTEVRFRFENHPGTSPSAPSLCSRQTAKTGNRWLK